MSKVYWLKAYATDDTLVYERFSNSRENMGKWLAEDRENIINESNGAYYRIIEQDQETGATVVLVEKPLQAEVEG